MKRSADWIFFMTEYAAEAADAGAAALFFMEMGGNGASCF
jgi:hypothetical protein